MPIDALSVLCAQLTRDLLAIAKFLLCLVHGLKFGNAKRFLYIKLYVKYIKYSYSVFCLHVGLMLLRL